MTTSRRKRARRPRLKSAATLVVELESYVGRSLSAETKRLIAEDIRKHLCASHGIEIFVEFLPARLMLDKRGKR